MSMNWSADAGRVVADDEHRDVAFVLKLAQLAQGHGPSERDVARGGINAQLHPQGPPLLEARRQLAAMHDVLGIPGKALQLPTDRRCARHGRRC
jgi:hypothetical protein